MRNFRKNLWLSISLIAVSLVLTNQAQAQCVVCTPAPPGWICTSGGQGGEACTMDGINCTLINPCTCRDRDCPVAGEGPGTSAGKVKLNISHEVIETVRKVHPRFALALISLGKLPPLGFSEGKIYSAPIELSETDVEWHLKPSQESEEYFAQLKEKVQQAFGEGKSPAVYAFSIIKPSAADGFILKLQVEQTYATDPISSSLEVNLSSARKTKNRAENEVRFLEAGTWRIN